MFDKRFRRALTQWLLGCDDPHHVGVAEQKVEVVAAEEDGLVLLARELVHDVDQLDFARIVEEGSRLVHENEGRVLHQCLGNHHFLLLAVAQGDEVSVDQMADADGFKAVVDNLFVFGFQFGQEAEMGIASCGHDVEDLQEKVVGLFGEHEAEQRTALGGRVVAQVLAEQLDFAASRWDPPRPRCRLR